jgi:hypothetical protein
MRIFPRNLYGIVRLRGPQGLPLGRLFYRHFLTIGKVLHACFRRMVV